MRFSAFAGSFAALAGLLGKLSADGHSGVLQFLDTQCQLSALSPHCSLISSAIRVLCLALMLSANTFMLRCFVKGLHETDSLTATVTSATVNFLLSAAGGFFFFEEHLPPRWFVGATIILIGMVFLLQGDVTESVKKKKD